MSIPRYDKITQFRFFFIETSDKYRSVIATKTLVTYKLVIRNV